MTAAEIGARRGRSGRSFVKYWNFDSTPAGQHRPVRRGLMDRLKVRQNGFAPGALRNEPQRSTQGHMFGGAQLMGESRSEFDTLTQ